MTWDLNSLRSPRVAIAGAAGGVTIGFLLLPVSVLPWIVAAAAGALLPVLVLRRRKLGPVLLTLKYRPGRGRYLAVGGVQLAMAALNASPDAAGTALMFAGMGLLFIAMALSPLQLREGGMTMADDVWRWGHLVYYKWRDAERTRLELHFEAPWWSAVPVIAVAPDEREQVARILARCTGVAR